jgi:hypothetical protein
MALVLLVAVLSGVFIWLMWPLVIPVVFPGAVASGMIAKEISLSSAILLSWLSSLLFKSSTSKINKGDK